MDGSEEISRLEERIFNLNRKLEKLEQTFFTKDHHIRQMLNHLEINLYRRLNK